MAEQEHTAHRDDLALDAEESEGIVGGSLPPVVQQADEEIARLLQDGWIEQACTKDGTRLFNPHTKKTTVVSFKAS